MKLWQVVRIERDKKQPKKHTREHVNQVLNATEKAAKEYQEERVNADGYGLV